MTPLEDTFPISTENLHEVVHIQSQESKALLNARGNLKRENSFGEHSQPAQDENTVALPETIISPNKKTCPRCKRLLRTRCFVHNPKLGKLVCNSCHKGIGNNKWFVPKEKRTNNFIGRFSMSDEEKKVKVKQYMLSGFSYAEAWKKVNFLNYSLNKIGRRQKFIRSWQKVTIKRSEQENTEAKKAFLEGLK